jgi:uncharacterized protein
MILNDMKGHWALITGASAGIGAEFAKQLAEAGVNVVLTARRKALLNALAGELRERNAIMTKVIEVDLTQPDAPDRIREQLAHDGIRIRLLCNNAGAQAWAAFTDSSSGDHRNMVELNISAVMAMCHAFHDDLASHANSAVINVVSPSAYQPVPYLAVYAASKAFLLSFSQALHGEWEHEGISVQALVVGPTDTPGFRQLGIHLHGPFKSMQPARQVVEKSLSRLHAPVAMAAAGTLLQRLFSNFFPANMVIRTVRKMFEPGCAEH